MGNRKLKESEGLLFGYGLFETMQSYAGKIFAFEEHLNRLHRSAKKINLKIAQSRSQLKKAANLALKRTGLQKTARAYIRINVWKQNTKSNFNVIAKKYVPPSNKKYESGFKAAISSFVLNENSGLAGIKSLNYLANILAKNEAQKRGFDEAIFLNTQGFIADGSRSNIFIVKRGKLLTPSLDCGILPGITRKIVLNLAKKNKIKIKETRLTLKDLLNADEAFVTNSLIQIMPLTAINQLPINRKKIGPITKKLMLAYENLLRR